MQCRGKLALNMLSDGQFSILEEDSLDVEIGCSLKPIPRLHRIQISFGAPDCLG